MQPRELFSYSFIHQLAIPISLPHTLTQQCKGFSTKVIVEANPIQSRFRLVRFLERFIESCLY
jgi:hypothetical protein